MPASLLISVRASLSISNSDMRRFILKVGLFALILFGVLFGSCFFLHDSSAGKTMLGAQRNKMEQFNRLSGERVLIVGGSGCGQGLVTSNLCIALNRPVYNMGVHAGLGIIYQMASVEKLVRAGDVVVLVPEYANFDGYSCFGDLELLMLVFDIIPEHKTLLEPSHWMHLLPVMPKYGADKIRHLFCAREVDDKSNDYDAYGDRKLPPSGRLAFPVARKMSEDDFSPAGLDYIKNFRKRIADRGGIVLLLPPAYQRSSYLSRKRYIDKIADALDKAGMPFMVDPERYALNDELFYDTPYHLNLTGRQIRTMLVQEDLISSL